MDVARYKNLSITLPEGMVDLVDQAAEREHRTRSEFIREALRVYMTRVPLGKLTAEEAVADRDGHDAYLRREFVTLDQITHDVASRRRPTRKKTTR